MTYERKSYLSRAINSPRKVVTKNGYGASTAWFTPSASQLIDTMGRNVPTKKTKMVSNASVQDKDIDTNNYVKDLLASIATADNE